MKNLFILITAALSMCASTNAQTITTIAGNHTAGYSGDGYAATSARLHNPGHIAFDNAGNIYFGDYGNNAVRKIAPSGEITTVAGHGTPGYSGDGLAATSATLNGPNGVVTDQYGNIYIADEANSAIRKVNAAGIITTVAGTGTAGYNGDGIAATAAQINFPDGVSVDDYGNLYISDTHNNRIRKVNTAGMISTIAGTGVAGFSGDCGSATSAMLNAPVKVCVSGGNIFVADQSNQRIRKIDVYGNISTIAGNGTMGYGGDGGPATAASLFYPASVTVSNGETGSVFFADAYNNRIRKVDAAGTITTVVGTGTTGYFGDGGPASAAQLDQPWGLYFDQCGNMLIGDAFNNTIRKVEYFTGMPAITGSSTVSVGSTVTLTNTITGGTWSSSQPGVATVGSITGVVTAVSPGTDTITYSTLCGNVTQIITVHLPTITGQVANGHFLSVFPNPTSGEITLSGVTNSQATGSIMAELIDMTGRRVCQYTFPVDHSALSEHFHLSNTIPNGIYILKLYGEDVSEAIRISVYR